MWVLIYVFLAWFSESYCNRKSGYYSLSTNVGWGGGYQQNPFWGHRRPKRQFLSMSDINFIYFFKFFYCFLPRTINWFTLPDTHLSAKSFQFGQSVQFGGGLDTYEWGWIWVKIQLCCNLGEGVLRGEIRKICPF